MRSLRSRVGLRSKARTRRSARRSQVRMEPHPVFGRRKVLRKAIVAGWIAFLKRGLQVERPMLLLALLLGVGAAGAGLVAGGYASAWLTAAGKGALAFSAEAGFAISEVRLRGNERTPAGAVYAALEIEPGQSIFTVDPWAARESLRALPWVADAEVRRYFPDALSVRLVEKRPFALWQSPDGLVVVERGGARITGASFAEFAKLPLLLGTGAPQAAASLLAVTSAHIAVASRLRAAERISDRRWDLHLDGGVVVRLPERDPEGEIAELDRLIVESGVLERDVEMIDLRFPDRYIFRLRNGDSQPVKRGRPA